MLINIIMNGARRKSEEEEDSFVVFSDCIDIHTVPNKQDDEEKAKKVFSIPTVQDMHYITLL